MKFEGTVPKTLNTPFKAVDFKSDFKLDNGYWDFPEQMGPPYVGFIYVIFDVYLKRAYLGKKTYLGAGVKNRGKDTGWRTYKSSSKLLEILFKKRPLMEFEFICLEQYKTKGTLSYSETWSLCLIEAPTSKVFYNTRIEAVSWPVKERITDRHKERLSNILKEVGNA
jgi:hypothetical protein